MDATLADLLERNRRHVEALDSDHFADVQNGQAPGVVSMSCADSRVPQDGMFAVEAPGVLFTPSTIGNRVWQVVDGERVVDGSLLYPLVHTDTRTAVVVGHTGCGAVTAALGAYRDGMDEPPGIRHDVEQLVPIVAAAFEAGVVDEGMADDVLVNRLVEYNVDAQVAFFRESSDVPEEVDGYGMVYDFQRIYGETAGALVLVNANGETDVDALRAHVPERFRDSVRRLTGR